MESKIVSLAAQEEENKVARSLMVWINTFPDLPVTIDLVQYEQLPDGIVSMAISAIQGTFITKRFITGGHEAEYQFKIIYRIQPGTSNDKRLSADELLDQIGSWATSTRPDLGTEITCVKVEATSRASVFAAYDNGDEDHQILMKLTYEVT